MGSCIKFDCGHCCNIVGIWCERDVSLKSIIIKLNLLDPRAPLSSKTLLFKLQLLMLKLQLCMLSYTHVGECGPLLLGVHWHLQLYTVSIKCPAVQERVWPHEMNEQILYGKKFSGIKTYVDISDSLMTTKFSLIFYPHVIIQFCLSPMKSIWSCLLTLSILHCKTSPNAASYIFLYSWQPEIKQSCCKCTSMCSYYALRVDMRAGTTDNYA